MKTCVFWVAVVFQFVYFCTISCRENCVENMENPLISVNFEVFGRVQGVFFRKYTQKQAKLLGLKGFCLNTEQGTVQGKLQGKRAKVEEMKTWLKTVGSPSSRIEKAVFTNEEGISKFSTDDFVIKR